MEHAFYFVWKSDPVSVFMVHIIKTKLPKQSVVKETRAVSEPFLIFIPCQQFPHGDMVFSFVHVVPVIIYKATLKNMQILI